MFSEDYILRMIRMATAAMAQILRLKKGGQYPQAIQAIDQTLEEVLGLKADLIRALEDESVLSSLTQHEQLDTDRLLILADLFYEEGDILAKQGRPAASQASSLRALNFYLDVILDWGVERISEKFEKIEDLVRQLGEQTMPPQTCFALYFYYQQVGDLSAARRILERLKEYPDWQEEALLEEAEFDRRIAGKQNRG
jgi:tetratricopeptide (TPR) repeat protein